MPPRNGRGIFPRDDPGRDEALSLYIELARDLATRLGGASPSPALATKEQ